MLGLSLIHAGFLAAGLAVAIPIVIHLLFRQRSRIEPIGSLRFLRQIVKEHERRRRVRQWLLLALRMLAIALLVLLFARPYWNDAARQGLQQEVVLLIDRSASLQTHESGSTRLFEQGVAKAREEFKRIDANAIVHVAFCDSTAVNEVSVEELDRVRVSHAATDYGLALDWAGDLLANSSRTQRQIVFYTDLQRSGLPRGRATPLPAGVDLLVKPLGGGIVHNLTVELAEALHTELRPDREVVVRAVLRNHGPAPLRQVPVECELNTPQGPVARRSLVDIPLQGREEVEFPFRLTDDATYWGEVRVMQDDAFATDNRRFLAFEARHPERVLLVDGQEGRSVFTNETYFLETALRLTTDETEGRLRSFEPDRMVWESGEGFPNLAGFRVVVLANLRRLSAKDGDRLREFVEQGGKLLIFAGDQTTRETLEPLHSRQLLPGRAASRSTAGPLRIDSWDESHPAFAPFRDPQQGDLRRIVLDRALLLEELVEEARPLLSSQGRVVCAERPVGQGSCLYLGTTADRDWTDLPRTRLFVPLMRQLLAHLTDQLETQHQILYRDIGHSSEEPGVNLVDEQWQVTNLDPREGDPRRVELDEFHRLFGAGNSGGEDRELAAAWAKILPADRQRPEELWTVLAWILWVVLAAELLLSSRVHA
ncbi:MAG: BatA domain-containing protein [Planctomycetaceae bacterium]